MILEAEGGIVINDNMAKYLVRRIDGGGMPGKSSKAASDVRPAASIAPGIQGDQSGCSIGVNIKTKVVFEYQYMLLILKHKS